MSTIYLVTGPAAVGKSTVSDCLAKKLDRSVHIEGDQIYNFVVGGYVSPHLPNNHLNLFWKNSLMLIENYIKEGFDVIFSYIIFQDRLEDIKEYFPDAKIKLTVLMSDINTLKIRDSNRPLDWQMGDRLSEMVREFDSQNFNRKFILDNSHMSADVTASLIKSNDDFIV